MISIGADVLYAAVNADSPDFEKARALVGRLGTSTEVVISEQTLISLYGALVRKGAADAASVIRYFRRNPNWRVVDVQSSRLEMNVIWDSVFAGGEDLPSIRRRRIEGISSPPAKTASHIPFISRRLDWASTTRQFGLRLKYRMTLAASAAPFLTSAP